MDRTGTRIRARRLDANLAQRDLAVAVGISPSYLNLIEHDRRRIGGKLLSRIAAELGVDVALLADGADRGLVDQLRSAAATMSDIAVEAAQVEDLAGRYPGWARLITAQARSIAALERRAQMLTDRITYDPALAEALHGVISAVTSIQSTAAILTGDSPVDSDWQARFHRNIHDDALRLATTSTALVSYLDAPVEAAGTSFSPLEEMEQVLATTGFHRAGIEADSAEPDPGSKRPAVAQLLAAYDARYRADAQALPLDNFVQAARDAHCDPIRLSARTGRPLAQVMRRLASLPVVADVPPLGLMICDASGSLRLLRSVPGFALARGGICPLWPIFAALGQPGRPVVAPVALPGNPAPRLMCHAVAEITPHPAGPHLPPLVEATMLVHPDVADDGTLPVPAGINCRICPRPECPARREPAAVTPTKVFDS